MLDRRKCRDRSDQERLAQRHPAVAAAYYLSRKAEPLKKAEVEARSLARQTHDDIAVRCQILNGLVAEWSDNFRRFLLETIRDQQLQGLTVTNSDHNLIGDANGSTGFSTAHGDQVGSGSHILNPGLGPLANHGGPTLTISLLVGSPAINAGDNAVESVTDPSDQRGQGFFRISGGITDIGAYEFWLGVVGLKS